MQTRLTRYFEYLHGKHVNRSICLLHILGQSDPSAGCHAGSEADRQGAAARVLRCQQLEKAGADHILPRRRQRGPIRDRAAAGDPAGERTSPWSGVAALICSGMETTAGACVAAQPIIRWLFVASPAASAGIAAAGLLHLAYMQSMPELESVEMHDRVLSIYGILGLPQTWRCLR